MRKLGWGLFFVFLGFAGGITQRVAEMLYLKAQKESLIEGYNKAVSDMLAGLQKTGKIVLVTNQNGEQRQLVLVPEKNNETKSKEEK